MNKYIEKIAEYYKEASTHELLAQLPVAEKVKIAISAAIEDSRFRYLAPKYADIPRSGPSPQEDLHNLDNMTKDLKGKLLIVKETQKGSVQAKIGESDFWIFPSAAKLLTDVKYYRGAEVQARVQERKFKDGRPYWNCIGLTPNPGDDIP